MIPKQDQIKVAKDYLAQHEKGFFITLNSISSDRIKFEENLRLLTYWLNRYCYGESFVRNEKRLKIVAGIEMGFINDGLHGHLIITYSSDMGRSLQEVNAFVRKKWFKLISAKGSIYNALIDVRVLSDLIAATSYSLKNSNKYSSTESNVIYL